VPVPQHSPCSGGRAARASGLPRHRPDTGISCCSPLERGCSRMLIERARSLSTPPARKSPAMDPHDLERLLTREMPYGKYKGRVLAELPGHYLNWFAREGFPKGELGRLLALMHELDHNGLRPLLDPLRRA